ncbi:LysR family transcriptional regulator [Rhodobacteraceae bacterium Araon29]
MDLRQLKTFICVAESGALSRASDRLRIAQPALSRQIKLLEKTVGTELFVRHVRGMDLTDAGQILLARISGPLRQLEQSVFEVRSLDKAIHGEVKLGVLPTIINEFSIQLLQYVREKHPNIKLYVKEAYSVNLVEWLQTGELDAGFLYGPASSYHLQSNQLFHEEIGLMSPPGSLPPSNEIDVKDIADLPLALPNRPFGPRLIIDKIAASAGVSLEPEFQVDSFGIAVSMVASGMCHGFMPVSSLSNLVRMEKIEVRRIMPQRAERQLILARSHTSLKSRVTEVVVKSIFSVAKKMREEGSWQTHLQS